MTGQSFDHGLGAFIDVFCKTDGELLSHRLDALHQEQSTALDGYLSSTGLSAQKFHHKVFARVAKEQLVINDPNFFTRVNDAYFSRLEIAGCVTLTPRLRGAFVGAIATAPKNIPPSQFIAVYTKRARLCEQLLQHLDVDPVIDLAYVRLQQDLLKLADECRSEIARLEPISRKGRYRSIAPRIIIEGLFMVFDMAKGDFRITDTQDGNFEGAFAEFLKVAWEAVPTCHRTASPEEFVRKAVKMNRKWKKTGGGFS